MDSGMWILGLIAIPFIFIIIYYVLAIFFIIHLCKKDKKNKKIYILILIIILVLPIIRVVSARILEPKTFENSMYANVENINYEIEQIDEYRFKVYFYDGQNYYRAKEQRFNQQYESEVYLIKSGTEKRVGLNIDLTTVKTSKVYMKDYYDNKILIWERPVDELGD